MTIQELYEIMKQLRKQSIINMNAMSYNRNFQYEVCLLRGEIKAYTYIINLIESGGIK